MFVKVPEYDVQGVLNEPTGSGHPQGLPVLHKGPFGSDAAALFAVLAWENEREYCCIAPA